MVVREEIAKQALALPPADREYVIDVLEHSLDADGFVSAEIESAWAIEVSRRLEAYDRGEIDAIPAEDAMRELRRMLQERRAGTSR